MMAAGKIEAGKAMLYMGAQIVGAILASLVLLGILNGVTGDASAGVSQYSLAAHGLGANDVPPFLSVGAAFALEVVLTALFLFVIFNATSSRVNPATAGWAIGGYLFVAHLIGVPLGDSSLNPARSIGLALLQGGTALAHLWVFIVAPVVGDLLGLALYKLTEESE